MRMLKKVSSDGDGDGDGELDPLRDGGPTHGAQGQGPGAQGARADVAARQEDDLRLKHTQLRSSTRTLPRRAWLP